MADAPSKKPKDTPFRQQNLKAWRPILTPNLVILLFLIVGVVFIPIGVAVLSASNDVIEIESSDYSKHVDEGGCCEQNCGKSDPNRIDRNPCTISIEVPKQMDPPIYMYYKLTNYYQNHRRYVKSRSDQQLRGLDTETELLKTSCQHRVYLNNSEDTDHEQVINPCGLIAWSFFNDSFALKDETGTRVAGADIDKPFKKTTGVAWESDVNMKFKNSKVDSKSKTGDFFENFQYWRNQNCDQYKTEFPYSPNELIMTCRNADAGWCFPGSGFCVEDQHFIVWMRTAGLPTFRKLYDKVEDMPLQPGKHNITIWNNDASGQKSKYLYPVHSFSGSKSIVLSTSSWIGGKNGFLGGAYLTVGIICLVLAAGFAAKVHFFPK